MVRGALQVVLALAVWSATAQTSDGQTPVQTPAVQTPVGQAPAAQRPATRPSAATAPSRGFDFELRQTLDAELTTAIGHIDDSRARSARAHQVATLSSVLAAQGCDATPDAYWDAAARWMVENVTPRLNPGAVIDEGPYGPDLRRQIENVENRIDAGNPGLFQNADETAGGRPGDRTAALRQRAAWAAALPAQVLRLRAVQETDPSSLRYALAFAVWTHSLCVVRTGHLGVARATLIEIGYPDAVTHGAKTELAFAVVAAASGDAGLAQDALTRGGANISPQARRLLESVAAR